MITLLKNIEALCEERTWSKESPSQIIDLNFLHCRIEKREKYSRRRAHQDEADIDYINERNMKFNKKLARFYDPFTSEIKQNLERGTAI